VERLVSVRGIGNLVTNPVATTRDFMTGKAMRKQADWDLKRVNPAGFLRQQRLEADALGTSQIPPTTSMPVSPAP
jgi:hypothetical protein